MMNISRRRPAALVNTLIVASGYLLSRILGLVRDILIANQYGTSPQLDAFWATFGILDLIYLVIAGGALGTAFIPVFAGMLAEQRDEDAWRLFHAIGRLACVALVATCLLIGLLADPLVALTVGRGFDQPTRDLAAWLLRLMLLQPFLLGLGGIAKATLESFDQFRLPTIAANLYNLGIIAGAMLAPWLGINGLALGVVGGALVFLLVQLPGLYRVGLRLPVTPWLNTPGVAQIARQIGPRLFGQSVWQVNLLAVASFASLIGDGAVSANRLAFQLMLLPHGLVALSAGTVLFPQLARLYATGERTQFREQVLAVVRLMVFVALPATVLLGMLAVPVVRLLFERGAFQAASTVLTVQALPFYMLGLAGFAAAEILVRSFYAMQDTRTPVGIALVAVLFNLACGYTLVQQGAGLAGLALAFSLANTLEAALLLWALARRLGGLPGDFWGALARMLGAAGLMALAIVGVRMLFGTYIPADSLQGSYTWPADLPGLLIWLVVLGSVAGAIYLASSMLLRLPEVTRLASRWRRR